MADLINIDGELEAFEMDRALIVQRAHARLDAIKPSNGVQQFNPYANCMYFSYAMMQNALNDYHRIGGNLGHFGLGSLGQLGLGSLGF